MADRGTQEWRDAIAEGRRRGADERTRRELALAVMPADIHAARTLGNVRPEIAALLPDAEDVFLELMAAMGATADQSGRLDEGAVSPQVRMILGSIARLQVMIGAHFLRCAQKDDLESASKLTGAISAQAKLLGQVGLERFERGLNSLDVYRDPMAAGDHRTPGDGAEGGR